MPAFLPVSASRFPTSAACSVLSPLNDAGSWIHDADATVRRASSSTSCAKIPRFERNTSRRGRSAVPRTLPRTRRWRRRRACRVDTRLICGHLRRGDGSCPFPDLPADELALVADALALVRLRRADLKHLRGRPADELLVDAAHDHLRRRGHLEGNALARLDPNGMRIADLK